MDLIPLTASFHASRPSSLMEDVPLAKKKLLLKRLRILQPASRLRTAFRRTWRRMRARSVVRNPNYRGWAFVQAADEARESENRTGALELYGRAIDSYLQEGQSGAAEIICERVMAVEPMVLRTRCTLALIAIGHEDVETAIVRVEDYFAAVAGSQGAATAIPSLLEMAAVTGNPSVRKAIASAIRHAGEPALADAIEAGEAAPAERTSWSRAVAGALKRPDEVDVHELSGEIQLDTAGGQQTILIVDDDENAREIYDTILREAGFRVILGADGVEGFRLARRHLPDLILLDLEMPKLDGWKTAEALRADPTTSHTIILALTVIGEGEDPRDPVQLGFDAHYVKPISPKRLVTIVQTWIGGGQHERDAHLAAIH